MFQNFLGFMPFLGLKNEDKELSIQVFENVIPQGCLILNNCIPSVEVYFLLTAPTQNNLVRVNAIPRISFRQINFNPITIVH